MRRLALLAVLWGCSKGPALEPAPPIPDRVETAGDRLLGLVPAGPSALVEIDAHRLRTNAVVGRLVAAVAAQPDEPDRPELLRLLLGILRHSDAAVIAIYDAGKDEARMLVLLRDLAREGQGTAVKLDAHTHAMGPPDLVERARELAGGAARPSVAADNELLALRARAMPERATGAWLRATARLSFDARVELASRFGLDSVPQRLSVWGDVADDLAIVALLGGDNQREAQQLGEQVRGSLQRVREAPAAARLLLSPVVRGLTVKVGGLVARTTVVIGPRALQAMVDSLKPMFERKDPPPSDPS